MCVQSYGRMGGISLVMAGLVWPGWSGVWVGPSHFLYRSIVSSATLALRLRKLHTLL